MFDLVSQDIFDSAGSRSAAPRLLERFQLNLSDDDAVLHMQQVRVACDMCVPCEREVTCLSRR